MKIEQLWLDAEYKYVKTDIGYLLVNPNSLVFATNATLELLNNFEISSFGVHGTDVDKDINPQGFLDYREEPVYQDL
ncbi:MAG: hypothetical protein ABI288_10870 [Ginsengibacter sp.]